MHQMIDVNQEHRIIMFLPMINNRNTKQNDQKFSINDHNIPKEEFGLGIQVFKIQSTKAIESNPPKPKKTIKNVENPILQQPTVQTVKRGQILPSLSSDKKAKTGGLNDTFKQRKATVQKKKLVLAADSIKQFDEKHRPFEKKISSVQQVNKTAGNQPNPPAVSQKQIIQKHYRSSLNLLQEFYEKFEDRQAENVKEIKRLKKLKQNNNQEELARQMMLRQNKLELAYDIVERENLAFFEPEQQYDEFSITNYTQGGYQFKHEDVELAFQY